MSETDLPRHELIQKANEIIRAGGVVFVKFTCENCRQRLTFDTPNAIFENGTCDKCGHTTPIKKGGLLVLFSNQPYKEFVQKLTEITSGEKRKSN